MDKKDWLDAATAKIRFGPDRKAARRELEDHLEDARERRTAAGTPEDEAEAAALRSMGDPEAIAEELGRIHRPWLGYLWRVSQAMLMLTVLACVLLVFVVELLYQPLGRAGNKLHAYLTPFSIAEAPEEREIPAGTTIKTGGYTITADRAVLRRYDAGAALFVDLHVGLGWRREPLLLRNAWSGARSSEGAISQRTIERHVSWAFWQKACIAVEVPEDAKWVELDFGYGELLRTLRIDLTEEVEG